MAQVETQLINVTGSMTADLYDPQGIGPQNIIQRGHSGKAHVVINLHGPGAVLLGPGHFHVTCSWERIGDAGGGGGSPAEGQVSGSAAIVVTSPVDAKSQLDVSLPSDLPAGVYKLAVYAQVHVVNPGPQPDFTGIAGFVDGGMFQVYA